MVKAIPMWNSAAAIRPYSNVPVVAIFHVLDLILPTAHALARFRVRYGHSGFRLQSLLGLPREGRDALLFRIVRGFLLKVPAEQLLGRRGEDGRRR